MVSKKPIIRLVVSCVKWTHNRLAGLTDEYRSLPGEIWKHRKNFLKFKTFPSVAGKNVDDVQDELKNLLFGDEDTRRAGNSTLKVSNYFI